MENISVGIDVHVELLVLDFTDIASVWRILFCLNKVLSSMFMLCLNLSPT